MNHLCVHSFPFPFPNRLAHSTEYINNLHKLDERMAVEQKEHVWLSDAVIKDCDPKESNDTTAQPDTYFGPGSLKAAKYAAGGVLHATQQVSTCSFKLFHCFFDTINSMGVSH
jgi:acetoin utilization deacetylase AcuC-like enzyme